MTQLMLESLCKKLSESRRDRGKRISDQSPQTYNARESGPDVIRSRRKITQMRKKLMMRKTYLRGLVNV